MRFCIILLIGGVFYNLYGQESIKSKDTLEQKLFFVPSVSSLTGVGAGIELAPTKKLFFGLMAGTSAPDFIMPPYKGNQLNGRLYMGVQVARTALLLGGYIGNFDFAQDVEVASISSITVSGRYQLDNKGKWFVEAGVAPLIPEYKISSGIRIPSHNRPPFIFLSFFFRFKDKQPEKPEVPEDDPYSYPPVFY